MPGGVYEIENIICAVERIFHTDGLHFDSYATFTLQLHGIQNLLLHMALVYGVCELKQAIGESGLAVVNMGDDGKIAYLRDIHMYGHTTRKVFLVKQTALGTEF